MYLIARYRLHSDLQRHYFGDPAVFQPAACPGQWSFYGGLQHGDVNDPPTIKTHYGHVRLARRARGHGSYCDAEHCPGGSTKAATKHKGTEEQGTLPGTKCAFINDKRPLHFISLG